jgi:hypothetical protein
MRTLEELLVRCEPIRRAAIARFWGADLPDPHSPQAVGALASHMARPEGVLAAWTALNEAERAALSDLLAAEQAIPWLTFTRRWGEVQRMGPARLERLRPWEHPTSPAEGLWYRGLLFRDVEERPEGLIEVAVLPAELAQHLPARPASPLRLSPTTPPPVVQPADDTLLDDGCTLLACLQSHAVRPRADGAWPAAAETALRRHLRQPDPDRLAFLRHLAQRLDWLRLSANGHLRPNPTVATVWLQAPAQQQRDALAGAWRDDPTWNDLRHVPTLRFDDTGSWRNDPLRTRQAFLHFLTACRPGEWYALTDLAAAIKQAAPDFQRPDGDYSAWYIRDAASGAYLSGFESWDAVEGALIRYYITGPLAWLGLTDLGCQTPEARGTSGIGAISFRLSPAGARFLGLAEAAQEEPPPPPPLAIASDLTIRVPAARRYERFQLSRVARWERSGDLYIYRLTPDSLTRARQQSIAPERVMAFLEQASGGKVPHNLRAVLQRWSQHGAEVRLERGILLRVRDEALLRRLTTAPATRHLIREVLGPTTALVASADWPRLARALVEEGLLPDLIGLEEECESEP